MRDALPTLDVSYHDDPRVMRKAATEDYSLHIVPLSWRNSRGSLSMAWFGLMSAMFWVVVGSTVTLAVGTVDTLIGIGLSVIVYGLINGAASMHANRTGTSVALFSRTVFGRIGAAFAVALFGLTIAYYVVAEGAIVAAALAAYVGGIPIALWYLVVVLYQAPLAFRGVHTWLDKLNGVLLPLYVLGLVGSVVWVIVKYGYSNAWLNYEPATGAPAGVPGWWYAFTVYMGVWVVTMMTWDYARFGKRKDLTFNRRVTFGSPFYVVTLLINAAVGIFIVNTIPISGTHSEKTVILAVVSLMGVPGLLWVLVSQTRVNTGNFYLASTNWQSFFARVFKLNWPRTAWLAVVAVAVYLMMLTDVLSYILQALQYQGVLIVGWVSIALTHIARSAIRREPAEQAEFRPGRVPLVNVAGLAAWGVSAIVGIALLAFGGTAGTVWAPPVTAVLATVVYLASLRFARRDWLVLERPHDPRHDVDDPWQARIPCHVCGDAYIAFEMDRDPSANHEPICLACGAESTEYLEAAQAEAREAGVHAVS